ncbi:MAG: hypothetical protein Q4F84_09490 [Fibrobacter sp.]|nr:hypothetical protein [Fibrobacter sp.]
MEIIPELDRQEATEVWDILLPVNDPESENRKELRNKAENIDYTTPYTGLNGIVTPMLPSEDQRTGFNQGLDFIGRFFDNFGIDITGDINALRIGGIGPRGFFRKSENFIGLSGNSHAETIIHEMLHWYDQLVNTSVLNSIHDFYVEITTSELFGTRNPLKDIPGTNPKERYRDSNIPVPHEGYINYTMKDYSEIDPDTREVVQERKEHEMLQQFGKYFYRNPRNLYEKFEQFYNRMTRVLKNE